MSPKRQSAPIEFPYRTKLTRHAGPLPVAYVWLDIKAVSGIYKPREFLFDTGADFTSLPKSVAEEVGAKLETLPEEVMYTANNEPMTTYHLKIAVRLNGKEFELPCVLTDRDDTPFLLGRAGFIDRFDMFLLAKGKKLVFKEVRR